MQRCNSGRYQRCFFASERGGQRLPFFIPKQSKFDVMAVVKLSPLVSEIRGKVGGVVFQTSPYGQIAKINNFRAPVSYTRMTGWDNTKKNIEEWWGLITPADQEAWGNAAINFPTTNRYGDPVISSGHNFFNSVMSIFPTSVVISRTVPPVPVVDGTTYSAPVTISPGQLRCTTTRLTGATNAFMIIDTSPALRSSLLSPPNRWRRVSARQVNAGPSIYNFLPDFLARWGMPLVGAALFVRVTLYVPMSNQVIFRQVTRLAIP